MLTVRASGGETTTDIHIFNFTWHTITIVMSMCKYIWQEEACSQVDSNSERRNFISINQSMCVLRSDMDLRSFIHCS